MADENIIDFGSYVLPKSWDELTLGMFSKIERYYADKDESFDVRNVLEVFTAHSKDEIDQLPIEFVEKLLEALKWLSESPQYGEPTNELVIDGEKYHVNIQEKLKTGEYIAFDSILKEDRFNYAAMLAILCRKDGEAYDSKFENEVLPSRIEFWERQPMLECMRIVSFFLNLWLISESHTQLYSKVMEAIDLERQHIQHLRKSGDLSMFSTKCAMRKLRKLEKSIKSI